MRIFILAVRELLDEVALMARDHCAACCPLPGCCWPSRSRLIAWARTRRTCDSWRLLLGLGSASEVLGVAGEVLGDHLPVAARSFIDDEALNAAQAQLGTSTIKDTANQALRGAAQIRDQAVKDSLDVLGRAQLDRQEDAWR